MGLEGSLRTRTGTRVRFKPFCPRKRATPYSHHWKSFPHGFSFFQRAFQENRLLSWKIFDEFSESAAHLAATLSAGLLGKKDVKIVLKIISVYMKEEENERRV